jgi:hypothetical protein
MREALLIEEEPDDLLPQMAGVFRWKADGSWWCARLANSHHHGQGPTPEAAMRAAIAAAQPRKRERLE